MSTDPSPSGIDALRERHQAMIGRAVAGETISAEECRTFINEVAAAGASTAPGRQRDRLRQILYHWAAEAGARGDPLADVPTLAPYDPAAAELTSARDGPAPAPPAAAVAPETTAVPQAASPTAAAPSPPAAIGAEAISADAASARANRSGVATIVGTVLKRFTTFSSGATEPAPTELAPPQPPPSPDIEALARTRAVIRIGALARQWLATPPEARAGYLLAGKALAEASLYTEDDPDIRTFVEASEEHFRRLERARRWRFNLVLAVICVIVVAALAFLLVVRERQHRLEAEASRARAEFEAEQAVATARFSVQTEIRSQARAAVNALNRNGGDLAPLKALLGRLADVEADELNRLTLSQQTVASTAQIESQAPASRGFVPPPPNAVPAPVTNAGTCEGYLWFGSPQDSRLADKTDPSQLRPNQQVAIDARGDIRLRADRPSPSYDLGTVAGVVPAGSTVTVASAPIRYDRSLGPQYWAKVVVPRQFCTTVYLQYQGSEERKNAALAALDAIGVQTPPAELIQSATGRREVRFFWQEDQAVAQQVAKTLKPFLPSDQKSSRDGLTVVPLLTFPKRPASGTLEVWLDFGR
ncbi:hypothetical protein [Methylobacterium nodulans]|uniref:Uncharacterized protein n=1 Tax=Methylobacterium nodulans (strain LMG 21967 / CNCM I-2342 / ORS 2060) TaxID=460265 RepID=B8ICU1_METNO|nr:hypothetical protein [Methylobacterium nodulans]ACL57502.1 hypothetical protein Mnod_2533 [Methylobacterium nodulans ORS 2060]